MYIAQVKMKIEFVFWFPSHAEQFKCIIQNEECGQSGDDDTNDEYNKTKNKLK